MANDSGWRRYRRRGEVIAEKRYTAWTWTTDAGEQMHANAGDWAVINDAGHERSVAADIFEATYEQTGSRRYRRVGMVLAKQAINREVIPTLEGDVVAEPGDWIVQGKGGERWPVSTTEFQKSYVGPLDADSSNTTDI